MKPWLCAPLCGLLLAGVVRADPVAGAIAGSGADSSVDCKAALPRPAALQMAFDLGAGVVDAVEQVPAEVALVARAGVDLKRFGVHYSHLGWLWRPAPDARWRVVHQLNACGSTQARLYETGPATFFMESLSAYDAEVMVPSPTTQARLKAVLASPLPEVLRGSRYNFFSHPDSATDQNSSAWALEVLAAALAAPDIVHTRTQAQASLHAWDYQPQSGSLTWYEKLGARLFYPRVIRLADQPDPGRYLVTSADSAMRLLTRRDPQTLVLQIRPSRITTAIPQADAVQQKPRISRGFCQSTVGDEPLSGTALPRSSRSAP